MDHAENAVQAFRTGLNCTQSILSAYSDELGMDKETALKVSGGFGGGMARMQETCGAVTGAVMVIGLKMIDKNTGPDMLRGKVYDTIQNFFRRFKESNKTTECRDLLNCDLRTTQGRKYFTDNNLGVSVCEKCIRDAAVLLDQMLDWN